METLKITLAMYVTATVRAARVAVDNWFVGLSFLGYWAIMMVSLIVAMPLGFLGGFLITFVWAACVGSFLYLVEMLVRHRKVTLDDFRSSFRPYLWDVIGVLFVLWILRLVVFPILYASPQGPVILLAIQLVIFVLFNAIPELIYLGHHSSLELLAESYRFIVDNWIEWFPPTLVAGGILLVILGVPVSGIAGSIQLAVAGIFGFFTMVMRGFLFQELHGSTRRSRAFRHRAR